MAVRTPRARTSAPSLTVVDSAPPSLQDRLAEAQRAAEGPAARVADLEQAMRDALAREDYAAAESLKAELGQARLEHGIAAAAVAGLTSAIVDAERRQAEDARVLAEASARTEARRIRDDALAADARAVAAIDAELGRFWDLLEQAKASFRLAESWQVKSGEERARAQQAMVVLGEREAAGRAVAPNRASVLRDEYPVVRALMLWAR